jgi:3-phosphoshikimate 1-carboxyvinyltransferase
MATMASSNAAATMVSLDRAAAAAPASSTFSRRVRMPARPARGMRLRGRGGAVLATSVAAPAVPAGAEEIVLQPIQEISGAVQLPGSKSLSNRILLLSALSEVRNQAGWLILLLPFG